MLRHARANFLRPSVRCLWAAPQPRMQQEHRHTQQAAAGPHAAAAAAVDDAGGPPSAAAVGAPAKPRQLFSYCRMCGGPLELVQPEADTQWRHVCQRCSYVDYQNPRLVVGCIVAHEGRILLCRRGIEPQRGLWTVPAGYLECGESSAERAARETLEEAGARVDIQGPFCHYDIPGISQIYVLFRARLAGDLCFGARQPESLEAALFEPKDIPWDKLAFSSVSIALRSYFDDQASGRFTVHHGVIQKRKGSGPNEPGSFQLVDTYSVPTEASGAGKCGGA